MLSISKPASSLSLSLKGLLDTKDLIRTVHHFDSQHDAIDKHSHRLNETKLKKIPLETGGSVIFIRHGKTLANQLGLLAGRSDLPGINDLTLEEGVKEAKDAANKLSATGIEFTHLVVSPKRRAQQTAAIIADTLNISENRIKVLGILSEHDCGVLENTALRKMTSEDKKKAEAYLNGASLNTLEEGDEKEKLRRLFQGDVVLGQTNGESMGDVLNRSRLAMQFINDNYRGKNVLIVSHATVGACMKILAGKMTQKKEFIDDQGCIIMSDFFPKNGELIQLS